MSNILRHTYNLFRFHTRDIGLVKRSGQWPTLEHHFLASHPTCAACGTHRHLQVHHIEPFHLEPKLELDPTNLIVLCMTRRFECHLQIGHGGDFKITSMSLKTAKLYGLTSPSSMK